MPSEPPDTYWDRTPIGTPIGITTCWASTGRNRPALAMTTISPAVFSATVLPPVLGPAIPRHAVLGPGHALGCARRASSCRNRRKAV